MCYHLISTHEIHHHVEEIFIDDLILVKEDAVRRSNIIAQRFSDSEDNDRVFAYTFGAAPVSKLSKEEDEIHGIDSSLNNIFNFINPDDFAVRYMELLEGYDRNGQTVFLTKQNDNAVWMNFEKNMFHQKI